MKKERIIALKALFDAGINLKLFEFLFEKMYDSNSTSKIISMSLAEWHSMYSNNKKNIDVSKEQVSFFLRYLCEYYPHVMELKGEKYSTKKSLNQLPNHKPSKPLNEDCSALEAFEAIS